MERLQKIVDPFVFSEELHQSVPPTIVMRIFYDKDLLLPFCQELEIYMLCKNECPATRQKVKLEIVEK